MRARPAPYFRGVSSPADQQIRDRVRRRGAETTAAEERASWLGTYAPAEAARAAVRELRPRISADAAAAQLDPQRYLLLYADEGIAVAAQRDRDRPEVGVWVATSAAGDMQANLVRCYENTFFPDIDDGSETPLAEMTLTAVSIAVSLVELRALGWHLRGADTTLHVCNPVTNSIARTLQRQRYDSDIPKLRRELRKLGEPGDHEPAARLIALGQLAGEIEQSARGGVLRVLKQLEPELGEAERADLLDRAAGSVSTLLTLLAERSESN